MATLRIKEICKEKEIAINELADKVGMSRVSISNMIAGRQSPPLSTLEKIADVLNVELIELFAPKESDMIICPKCGSKFQLVK